MSRKRVEVHMAGITSDDERAALEEHLRDVEGVAELHEVALTRAVLTYDEETITATELMRAIEEAGAEVITMDER